MQPRTVVWDGKSVINASVMDQMRFAVGVPRQDIDQFGNREVDWQKSHATFDFFIGTESSDAGFLSGLDVADGQAANSIASSGSLCCHLDCGRKWIVTIDVSRLPKAQHVPWWERQAYIVCIFHAASAVTQITAMERPVPCVMTSCVCRHFQQRCRLLTQHKNVPSDQH
jgi:hypothetical protein